jgi:hypothetical protein
VKAVVLLPVLLFGAGAVVTWIEGPPGAAIAATVLALLFALVAVPNFLLRLVTTVDSERLHVRIEPLALPLPFLPPRVRDVPLSEISRCEIRTYKALSDRQYWGRHFWGLGTGRGGSHYIYLMKAGALSGRGVELDIRNGHTLLLGSARPEELAGAIGAGRGAS